MLKKRHCGGKTPTILTLICAAAALTAFGEGELRAQGKQGSNPEPLFLTATNGSTNYLAVIDIQSKGIDYVPTGGAGGASGNAGGVAVQGKLAAAVNFGSSNVTIFVREGNTMAATQTITTASKPVSVAFGSGHLVVLGQTSAESFLVSGTSVAQSHDGMAALAIGDGSAGQIVTYAGGAMYTETTGGIATLSFGIPGMTGPSVPVAMPAAPNNNTPLGLVGRGANVYVTIAHSDLETLVVNGKIVSTAVGPTPFMDGSGNLLHAPCWNALSGQFLYSSDSPGKQLLRYLVSDTNIFYDKAAVAQLSGPPTDLDVKGSLLGVIDGGDGVNSDVSIFNVDSEGELTLRFAIKIAGAINGAAIIQ